MKFNFGDSSDDKVLEQGPDEGDSGSAHIVDDDDHAQEANSDRPKVARTDKEGTAGVDIELGS